MQCEGLVSECEDNVSRHQFQNPRLRKSDWRQSSEPGPATQSSWASQSHCYWVRSQRVQNSIIEAHNWRQLGLGSKHAAASVLGNHFTQARR